MKRPSEYMLMTDGVTRHDYERELNKYIDYLEAQTKQLILPVVSNLLKAEDTDVPLKDYIEKYYELITLDRIYKSKNSDEHITESKLIAQYKRAHKL